MTATYRQMIAFFQNEGIADVSHTKNNYLAHVVAVYSDLKKWHADEDMCRAGMFHSIYGTELFQKIALPLERRQEIRDLIGTRAEKLAFWNCFMDRATFDQAVLNEDAPTQFRDRVTGEIYQLNPDEFRDLMTVNLCDWLEQVERSQRWDYRRPGFRRMAERLGGTALASYDEVFAREPAPAAAK
jgi:hypothetical protein